MNKTFLWLGACNAMLAVAFGAFGAHGLKDQLSESLMRTYETGAHYHMTHALGLLLIAVLAGRYPEQKLLQRSGWLLLMGIIFFCGSLYLLSVTDTKWLGAIAPIGGVSFLAGWGSLAWFGYRLPTSQK